MITLQKKTIQRELNLKSQSKLKMVSNSKIKNQMNLMNRQKKNMNYHQFKIFKHKKQQIFQELIKNHGYKLILKENKKLKKMRCKALNRKFQTTKIIISRLFHRYIKRNKEMRTKEEETSTIGIHLTHLLTKNEEN